VEKREPGERFGGEGKGLGIEAPGKDGFEAAISKGV
jgi:hypothetical protein